jgi:predicted SAM-dependent methyltransferase
MLKLHLGCGHIHLPGYTNIDIFPFPEADLVCDARDLPYEDNSVDFIYSCALIEEFGRYEWVDVLRHWNRKLKSGAMLRLSTSDFEAVCRKYVNGESLTSMLGLVIGGQRETHTHHGMVFDYNLLWSGLTEAGFEYIHPYDWKRTDIARLGIDDYSQAYLPHMDKENGTLMSLNVEAIKI